jgi:protein MpaA
MRLTSTLRPMQKDGFSGSPRQPGRPGWLLSRLPGFLLCGVAALATVPAAAAQDAPPPCTEWARRLPNLSTAVCDAAQLQGNGGRSVRGVPLYQRDVLPTGLTDGPRRRVLVIGGIHGDELSSTSLVLHWIGHAQQAPAELEWRFVPLLNPDGALKQRPTRVNARGVDLNRNFPTEGWAKQAHRYWADRTRRDPRRYPGPAPLSEPESRWLHDEMERWKPDLIVSVHAPYGVLDFDGPSAPPQRLGRLYLDQVGIFPGSLGNYGGLHKGVPVVTIELPSALRTPTAPEMRQMWLDLLHWMEERLQPPAVPRAVRAVQGG